MLKLSDPTTTRENLLIVRDAYSLIACIKPSPSEVSLNRITPFLTNGAETIRNWLSYRGPLNSCLLGLSNTEITFLILGAERVTPLYFGKTTKETILKAIAIAKGWLDTYQWKPLAEMRFPKHDLTSLKEETSLSWKLLYYKLLANSETTTQT